MNDQDDEKKIVNEESSQSNDENQTKIDSNDSTKPEESSNNETTSEGNESKDQKVDQNQELRVESSTNDQDSGSGHQVIHKKDGRLHIYVRQDKYKGELKSKNWVGRLYIDGKQKISSSGTPNLDEAIPILEKWFDDIHAQKEKEKEQKNLEQTTTAQETSPPQQTTATEVKTVSPTEVVQQNVAPTKDPTVESLSLIHI